jgi:hypothetical protein
MERGSTGNTEREREREKKREGERAREWNKMRK